MINYRAVNYRAVMLGMMLGATVLGRSAREQVRHSVPAAQGLAQVAGRDSMVRSDDGMELHVGEVRSRIRGGKHAAILLIHGARVPEVASFDLGVPGGRWRRIWRCGDLVCS